MLMLDGFSENMPGSSRKSPTDFSELEFSKLLSSPNAHPTSSVIEKRSVSVNSYQCQTPSNFHLQFNPANLHLNDPPSMPHIPGAVISNNVVRKTTRKIQWKYKCGKWPYWCSGDPSTPRIDKFGSAWLDGRRCSLRLRVRQSPRSVLRITAD